MKLAPDLMKLIRLRPMLLFRSEFHNDTFKNDCFCLTLNEVLKNQSLKT